MELNRNFSLEGRNILITGASSGLGREIAINCSEAGAYVALVGRNQKALSETLGLMKGTGHYCYNCELADEKKYLDLFNSIKNDMGKLSGFVHSAGIEITLPIKVSSPDSYRKILEINSIAALELSRYLLKKKYRSDNVSIIFIASIMGVVGAPALTAYSASKGAIIAAARSAALEYAGKGARFNCISPGHIVGTQMADELFDKLSQQAREDLIKKHPLGLGAPKDVGNACVFLLSEASRWITGTNLMVDGGYSAQ